MTDGSQAGQPPGAGERRAERSKHPTATPPRARPPGPRVAAMKYVAPELPETGPRYPDWILLATRAYISDRKNGTATVAESRTSDGHLIHASLFAATPPAVSHLRVHCPGKKEDHFSYNPAVVFSREDLILFDVSFNDDRDTSDYFVYKAAGSITPSLLVRVADPVPDVSVVCCGADHFAVAALGQDYMTDMFILSVFDSETGVWETRLLPLEPSESLRKPAERAFFFSKVIPLRGSLLGWVDLWRGILVCDVLSDDPKLRYIPMPEPMAGNEGVEGEGEPTFFRDVTGCDDVITFVEMDYEYDGTPITDTSLYQPDVWTAVIGSRRLDSMEEWKINHVVSIEDITVSEDCLGPSGVQICCLGSARMEPHP